MRVHACVIHFVLTQSRDVGLSLFTDQEASSQWLCDFPKVLQLVTGGVRCLSGSV